VETLMFAIVNKAILPDGAMFCNPALARNSIHLGGRGGFASKPGSAAKLNSLPQNS
jgi:hypothetical protein